MNLNIFEGKSITVEDIIDISETMPFLSEKRLIIVKCSELFQSGRKNDTNKMNDYLSIIPNTTCIIFIEDNVDKTNKLYKKIFKTTHVVQFNNPKENELINWIKNNIKKYGNDINSKTAIYMLKYIGTDMETLDNEIRKLSSYKNSDGLISENDINSICVKSFETKIFDMLDAIGNKKPEIALEIYNNMITFKEPPIKILTMIIRQFRLLFESKYLFDKGGTVESISKRLAQKPFIVKNLLNQSKNFSSCLLRNALEDCLQMDLSIKTGKISDKMGVELLIIKYSM